MSSIDADRIPVLAALKPKDREKVLWSARQRTYAPGEVVIREGDSALNLFLIASGRARVEQHGKALHGLGPGEFFGELGVLEEHARTATVVAEDQLTCVLLPAWEFRSLLHEFPEMALPMLFSLIGRLHGLSPHEH
jgi:CRP/FNR family cyclic AMP-dependent transcriptional regulator